MAIQLAGITTHFIVSFDDSLGPAAQAGALAVLATCEADLATMAHYMPYVTAGDSDPFVELKIAVTAKSDPVFGPGFGSALNYGYTLDKQPQIWFNPLASPGVPITSDFASFLFVAEMAEILMSFYGWDGGSSQGEALSRVMAEELHPHSATNFINNWFAFVSPRPDYINNNELSTPGIFGRGDLDSIAYGCGIVFLYFLRYQLNFAYYDICTAGGKLLSDKYHYLTHDTSNPATVLETLLDSHFGTGGISLTGNNPFPLLNAASSSIQLDFLKPTTILQPLPIEGFAKVKRLFNCPAEVYPYREYGLTVTQTVTATSVGIGIPTFQWQLNGEFLFTSGKNQTVTASVDVPQPGDPLNPIRESQAFTYDYSVTQQLTSGGGTSTLQIVSHSIAGDYQLDIHVAATETAVTSTPVTAGHLLVVHTRGITYGGSYGADLARCEQALFHSIGEKVHVIFDLLAGLKNLPNQPHPNYVSDVLVSAEAIREALARIALTDHPVASRIAQYAGFQLGVPAHVFLKGVSSSAQEPS